MFHTRFWPTTHTGKKVKYRSKIFAVFRIGCRTIVLSFLIDFVTLTDNIYMKAFNIFFIVVFIIFAALQYNDPDPYIWIPIYLYGAWLCYKAWNKQYQTWWYVLGFVVYLGYAVYLFLDKSGVINWAEQHHAESIAAKMKADKPWIEETREFFGLLIIVVVMLVNMLWLKRKKYASVDTVNSRSKS